jgi:hypothetical protein
MDVQPPSTWRSFALILVSFLGVMGAFYLFVHLFKQ